MTRRLALVGMVLAWLMLALAGCTSLPEEARQAALDDFRAEEQPRFHSAYRAEPLAKDLESGAEEVWCINVAVICYDCGRMQYKTSVAQRVVRQVNRGWEVLQVITEEDWEDWAARGCPEVQAEDNGGHD